MTRKITDAVPQSLATDVLETIDCLVSTLSVTEAWAIHCAAMARYGVDRMLYGFSRFNTGAGFGHKDDLLLLSSMPDGYLERFVNDGLYNSAPMTRWARDNVGAMSWSWIEENRSKLSKAELEVVEINRSFGLCAGYSIAFQDANTRHKAAIALVAQPGVSQDEMNAIWQEKHKEINIINQVAHLKFSALPLPVAMARLSARQREVLEWVGDGKTMQDIACILGVTQATVEKHLRNARDSLNVQTTAEAVRKASVLNQIFVVER